MTSERSIRWCAGHGVNCFTIPEPTSRLKRNVEIYYDELDKQGWPDRLNRGRFKYGWDADKKRGFAFCRNIFLVKPGEDRDQAWQRVKLAMELEWDYYGPFGFAAVLAEADEPGTGCLGRPARLAPGCGQVITLQDSCEPTFGPRLFRTSVVRKPVSASVLAPMWGPSRSWAAALSTLRPHLGSSTPVRTTEAAFCQRCQTS